MDFNEFKQLFQKHVDGMLEGQSVLFTTAVDKDVLWDTYLNSFPPGTNEVFRERREFDCGCCRHFVKSLNVVTVQDNQLVSLWDFETGDDKFQPVISAMSALVKSAPISDVFVTKVAKFGTDSTLEQLENGNVHTWEHFFVKLPDRFVSGKSGSEGSITAVHRDTCNVFRRSLEEISRDAIETVLELIAQKSLYKGEEWKAALAQFLDLHKEYHDLPDEKENNYCWATSVRLGVAVSRIRNHSIGVLLTDITGGMDLNAAVSRYEKIVAPTNYKRPKAVFTKRMVEAAQDTLAGLGLLDSLGRRYATLDDITVNNILFVNRDAAPKLAGNVFDELKQETTVSPKKFDKVEEVGIEQFVTDVLPLATNLEVLFENRHEPNLMSLIAPKVADSPTLFKWGNGFSWAYKGNIADSIKQHVKAAGGNIEGVLRFSIQWNDNDDNRNDYDAHCIEPDGNHIHFPNASRTHYSSGILDVDIRNPGHNVAVENITWSRFDRMQEGIYLFYVHNYSHNGGRTGFTAEIEYDGHIYEYSYPLDLAQDEKVVVAKLKFSKQDGVLIIESLPSTTSTKTIWGLHTNQLQPVSVAMFSPNYWDEQSGIGHRHYFFMFNDCINDEQPNGFFNEYLREDFMQHKHVFEALGAKMRVEPAQPQLSGLGFSSTKRNSLVVKVEGHFARVVKIVL